jgi:hypothetical protein
MLGHPSRKMSTLRFRSKKGRSKLEKVKVKVKVEVLL